MSFGGLWRCIRVHKEHSQFVAALIREQTDANNPGPWDRISVTTAESEYLEGNLYSITSADVPEGTDPALPGPFY